MSADGRIICAGERRWIDCVLVNADGWLVFRWAHMGGMCSGETDGWFVVRWVLLVGLCSGGRRWLACLLLSSDGWLVFERVQMIILCCGEHRWLVCVMVSAGGLFVLLWAQMVGFFLCEQMIDFFFGECWWSADGVVIRWYTQHLFQTIRYGHLNMGIILEYYFHPGLFYMVILHTSLVNHKVLFKKKTERRILPLVKGLWIYILHQVPAVVMWGSNTV